MKSLILYIFFIPSLLFASSDRLIKKVFQKYEKVEKISIVDPISDEPVNTTLLKVLIGNKVIGYVRNIATTTGCNSACLPVVYSSFYSKDGKFLQVLSQAGLTKLNHAPFTKEDYSKLEFILVMAPKKFDSIKHPKEMTDAISGATIKNFQDIVVQGAAYSTLRIHLYNQQTIKEIRNFLLKSK